MGRVLYPAFNKFSKRCIILISHILSNNLFWWNTYMRKVPDLDILLCRKNIKNINIFFSLLFFFFKISLTIIFFSFSCCLAFCYSFFSLIFSSVGLAFIFLMPFYIFTFFLFCFYSFSVSLSNFGSVLFFVYIIILKFLHTFHFFKRFLLSNVSFE